MDSVEICLLDADEELPPLANGGGEADDGSAEAEGGAADGGELERDADPEAELDELDAVSVDEADVQTEVPTAVKVGDEPSGDEETSPGTVGTPAVQLSAEDPEPDASG